MTRVFTISSSAPFLATLARALLDGELVPGFAPRGDPLALASATIYLPTRRAGRLLEQALLEEIGGDGLLLPGIVPLGDVDEDALAFSEAAALLAPPHAVASVHRRIALAGLVSRWRDALAEGEGQAMVAAGPAATMALADELGRLFDQMVTAGIPWSKLDSLVPEEHDQFFEISLQFLRIAREAWAGHLEESGLVDPAVRRDRLVEAEERRLAALGVEAGPVIAAGSTGSLPTTARLLKAIASLPQGAVVLPGLDLHMEETAFQMLIADATSAPDHPQFGLAKLLNTFGIERRDVTELGTRAAYGREPLLSEALRQSETAEMWATLAERLPAAERADAFAGISVIRAQDPREEALAVALELRDSLTRPGERAALITPDRDLARRVAAELQRFGIAIDDSAGEPLAETAPARLARLIAKAVAEGCAPVPVFALLSQPGVTLDLEPDTLREALAALELIALRGPRPRSGMEGLSAAVAAFDPAKLHARDPRRRVDDGKLELARDLVARLVVALAPLSALADGPAVPLADLVAAHVAAYEALCGPLDPQAEDPAEASLAEALGEIVDGAAYGPSLTLHAYADAISALLADRVVRPRGEGETRIRILGPLEARMVALDRVLLGGLAEGAWPPETRTDPWLSRPMRAELGLDQPERRIGLSAHDFVQAFGAREVVLTYPDKVGGTQSVPSRFLQRLKTVAGPDLWQAAEARGEAWRQAAARLDDGPRVPRVAQPAPTPPLALRPRKLSVTEVETFLRDPYSMFARHVLSLQPLEPLDAMPGGAERGTALHDALGEFAKAHPEDLPPDALDQLLKFGRTAFEKLEVFPAEHAIWWARFERVAAFVVEMERERRANLRRVFAEVGGSMPIPLLSGDFHLTCRADRIELRNDGQLAIVDYKTGTAPSTKQGATFSPQLPLEAAMAVRGSFKDVPAATVADFLYVELKGGAEAGKEKAGVGDKTTATDMAEEAYSRLFELLQAFENEAQGYRALAAPQWRGRYGTYDHLARVREWALGAEEAGE
ncbi:double-strand break repair protein AddB [Azorhizobium oxalatiphilum]|uniref:Double-strand break repair protein AddB n=1 Tax=Azorhizobium oxalatiphilum TaxID=980631 RepID=A0A917BMD5_9HYPH|nr:double-strand break repair protein AddB [Azorhizobium oxalatiphilum]GGF48249.1 double-strand break repair protein AddB [Azorhizobium oxalatiphilum]